MRKTWFIHIAILFSLVLCNLLTSAIQKLDEQRGTPTIASQETTRPTAIPKTDEKRDTPTVASQETSQPTATAPQDMIWRLLEQVNKDRALADLRQLTGEAPLCTVRGCHTITDRRTGSEGLYWTKDYIYQQLASLGYSLVLRDWTRAGYADQNLIARKPGVSLPEEEIYFVAHIDGVKTPDEDRFPAADDNASGAVDCLEVARVLSSYSFDRTIVFLFSTGEEEGTLGVQSYLSQLSQKELDAIKYVIDIDMVGYDANNDGVMQLWHADHPPSLALAQRMQETIQAYQLNLVPQLTAGCG